MPSRLFRILIVLAGIMGADGVVLAAASAHQADVTDKTSVERAIDVIVSRHGGLDILVNSAGIGIRRAAVELPLSDWDKVVAVNLTGVFLARKRRHA